MPVNDKSKYAYNYLISKGLTPIQSAGIVGNLQAESNLDTTVTGKADDAGSVGIAQWHSERKKGLMDFAKARGKHYGDLNLQLDYVVEELNSPAYSKAMAELQKAKTADQAAKAFMNHYERPAEWAKIKSVGTRVGVANAILTGTPYENVDYIGKDYNRDEDWAMQNSNLSPEQQAALEAYVKGTMEIKQQQQAEEKSKVELAKEKLLEKENEKAFIDKLNEYGSQTDKLLQQQAQQQDSGIDPSYYQLQAIQHPQYQIQQSPETYQTGGTNTEPQHGDTFTNYVLKPGAKLIAGAIHGADDLVDKAFHYIKPNGLEQSTREDIFKRFRPTSYPTMAQAAIDYFAKNDTKPGRDSQGDYDVAEEAWRKALDLPTKGKYITESKYKPSSAKDANAKYYTLNNIIDPDKITEYVKSRNGKKGDKYQMDALVPYMRDNVNLATGNSNADPLQNFQISVGEDKKGKYAAIYDKYDFDSLKAANRVIKPYEIYDRYYYKQDGGYHYPSFQTGGEKEELPKVVQVKGKDGKIQQMLTDSKEYQDLYQSGSLNTQDPNTGEFTYYLPEGSVVVKSKPRTGPILKPTPIVRNEYEKRDIENLLRESRPVRESIPEMQRFAEQKFVNNSNYEAKVKKAEDLDKAIGQKNIKYRLSGKATLEDTIENKDIDLSKYTNKDQAIKLQTFLANQGYNLDPNSQFANHGIDGKIGNVTRNAVMQYNQHLSAPGYESVKQGTGLLGKCTETQCSEYGQNELYRNMQPNVSRKEWNELTGLYGNAWDIGQNIKKAGGKEIKTKDGVKPGDVVTMYTGGNSTYQGEANKAGTGTTHTGIVDKVNPDGSYYILHNVHTMNTAGDYEGREYRDLVRDNITGTHNFAVRHVFRPDYNKVGSGEKKVIREDLALKIDPSKLKQLSSGEYNNNFTSLSAKQKLESNFIKPLNNQGNKKVLAKMFNLGDDEYNSLAKASLGILGQETSFGTNPKYTTGVKEAIASTASTIGLKSDEASKGAGRLKYETNFGGDDLTELGINKDNFDDEDKASLTTMYKLSREYKDFLRQGDSKKDALYKAITVYNSSLGHKTGNKTVGQWAGNYDVDYTNKVLNFANIFDVADKKKSYKTTSDELLLNPNVAKWNSKLKKQNKV